MAIYKSCSVCGKIHSRSGKCPFKRSYFATGDDRKLRGTSAWQKKSIEIREKANYLCEVCKDQGEYVFDDLEVHHIVKLKDDPTKAFDNMNLICLCQFHHRMADAGDIPTDYLMDIVERREAERQGRDEK